MVVRPEGLYRRFRESYARGRCLAYMPWALVEWAAEGDLPVDGSRAPAGLSGRANRLAERMREDYLRPAPRWPGNNVRGGWQSTAWLTSPAPSPPFALGAPVAGRCRPPLRALLEPPLDRGSDPERPATSSSPPVRASQGSLQQGVVFAVAKRFYRLAGAKVSSRHPFCPDRNAHRCGDCTWSARAGLAVPEVSTGGFSPQRLERTLARLPSGARALFLCPQPAPAGFPGFHERAALLDLSGFLSACSWIIWTTPRSSAPGCAWNASIWWACRRTRLSPLPGFCVSLAPSPPGELVLSANLNLTLNLIQSLLLILILPCS
ncbi:hypothetical protein HS125_18830 [bacterium]|nr:hypothetical protein [bacterium]